MADILARVQKVTIRILDIDPRRVTAGADFIFDLGADSLDLVELIMAFEREFDIEISDEQAERIHTVNDAVKTVEGQVVIA